MPFPYFGRKGGLARLYPQPTGDRIIEPFAGSGAYSLYGENWRRQVILIDTDSEIIELWRWLIHEETTAEVIYALPKMVKGDDLETVYGTGPALTMAKLISPSENYQKRTVTEWMERDWLGLQSRIAESVFKVKHWAVVEGDFTIVPNVEAMWFIDPPYQKARFGYKDSRQVLDYEALGEWCRERRGQVTVCEKMGAEWLPFRPLKVLKTIDNTRVTEAVWVKDELTSVN